MPRNARFVLPGVPHHVTQRGNNRQPVFFSAADRELYLHLVRDHLTDAGVTVQAYALMSNHVHWIITPVRADSLAVLFRRVHGRYAQYLNTRRRQSGHLWQARYFSCSLSPAHLDVALRYVEMNPVRAGVVEQPEAYAWSSAAAHLGVASLECDSWLDPACWTARGGVGGWRALLKQVDRAALVNQLRRCTFAERPFGDEGFVQFVETQAGRQWRRSAYESELRTADGEWRLVHLPVASVGVGAGTEQTVPVVSGTDAP